MKKINLNHFFKNLQNSILLLLATAALIIIGIHQLMNYQIQQVTEDIEREKIASSLKVYLSNLSEKLYIIANSSNFTDYLHSGEVTRKALQVEFDVLLGSLLREETRGIAISSISRGELLYSSQPQGNYEKISFDLCYLNDHINISYGKCLFTATLFIDKTSMLAKLKKIDPNIKICADCPATPISNVYSGSLKLSDKNNLNLALSTKVTQENRFHLFEVMLLTLLLFFGVLMIFRYQKRLQASIAQPLKQITDSIAQNQHGLKVEADIEEFKLLGKAINKWQAQEKDALVGKISSQVAHDIRSPISALEVGLANLDNKPEEAKSLIAQASQKIQKISTELLEKRKASAPDYIAVGPIVDKAIQQKQIEIANTQQVHIEHIIQENQHALVCAQDLEFECILSNLLNNSLEAMNHSGDIKVKTEVIDDQLSVSIKDNGPGIPQSILEKLGKEEITTKTTGNGLGVKSAFEKMRQWGGQMNIQSTAQSGTTVQLLFPIINKK